MVGLGFTSAFSLMGVFMLKRFGVWAVSAAVFGAVASPVMAQSAPDLTAQVAAFIKPTNAERTQVVVDQLRAAGFEPAVETFEGGNARAGVMEGRNVVATFGSGDKEILLTAHYDAVKLRDGSMSQGVVDNAASVVGVIEAAKILRTKSLNHRIRIILFDQEELGLIGAKKWIEAHGVANVAAVVNSDIAAYGDTMMYGQNNGAQSAGVTRSVQAVCSARALQCVGYPQYPPSDDRAFAAAGAPVISLGFQDQVGAHQMWLAFNAPRGASGLAEGFMPKVFELIHSADDSMAHVDAATIKLVGETYAAVIERLDTDLKP